MLSAVVLSIFVLIFKSRYKTFLPYDQEKQVLTDFSSTAHLMEWLLAQCTTIQTSYTCSKVNTGLQLAPAEFPLLLPFEHAANVMSVFWTPPRPQLTASPVPVEKVFLPHWCHSLGVKRLQDIFCWRNFQVQQDSRHIRKPGWERLPIVEYAPGACLPILGGSSCLTNPNRWGNKFSVLGLSIF